MSTILVPFHDEDLGIDSGSAYVFLVPEPSSRVLRAIALVTLAGLARRVRKRANA